MIIIEDFAMKVIMVMFASNKFSSKDFITQIRTDNLVYLCQSWY